MTVNKPPPKKVPGAPATPAAGSAAPAQNPMAKAPPPGAKAAPAAPAAKAPDMPALAPGEEPAIERTVFELPGMVSVPECEIFSRFIEKICPKIRLAGTSRQVMEAFASPDVTAEKVAQVMKANPYYENQFLRVIESMSKREELPKLDSAIVMMGMQNSRNLVVALQLLRMVKGTHPEWDTKTGKLKVAPKDVLRYTFKTEEALSGRKDAYADTAYAAGVMFDLLALVSSTVCEDKRVAGFIETVYAHGMRSAEVGIQLAKKIPDFVFKKYIFSACMIHDIGKVCMAMLEPKYLDFLDDCAKRNLPRAVRHYTEHKTFGITHSELGALCCFYFRIFKPVERAILFHHDPYLLRAGQRNQYQLSSLVCLASNVANNFKKVDKPTDPLIAKWKGPELRDFKVDVKDLIAAVSHAI